MAKDTITRRCRRRPSFDEIRKRQAQKQAAAMKVAVHGTATSTTELVTRIAEHLANLVLDRMTKYLEAQNG